jgi:hypothetical protein
LDGLIDFSEHENIPYSQTSSEFKVSNDTSSSRRPASSVYPLQSNDNGRWPGMHQQSTGKDRDIDSEGFVSPNAEPHFYSELSTDYIDSTVIGSSLPGTGIKPPRSSNVGRLWPGMHQQQAALAKA